MSKKAARDLEAERLWRAEAEKVNDDEPIVKRPPARKDTKQWCKGRVGRPHRLAIEMPPNAWRRQCEWITNIGSDPWYSCQHVELCVECGKVRRHAHGWMAKPDPHSTLLNEECPAFRPRPTEPSPAAGDTPDARSA